MQIGIKTDVGQSRENNQDSYYISSTADQPLFIIADGMGGHKAGEIASKMAIETVSNSLKKDLIDLELDDEEIKNKIENSIHQANEDIFKKSQEFEKFSGMGTTVTLAFIKDGKIFVGHAGDSRAYIYKDSNLSQITEDHTLVAELVKNGSINKEEARNHPQRNFITRAVGSSEEIKVDLVVEYGGKEDILLLCTDGLTTMLTDDEIKECLYKYDNVQIACEELVKYANNKGGFDNITILAVKL